MSSNSPDSIPPGQRVAIVGAGISGLVCGFLLRRRHAVTVFEANDYIGGHTHTHALSANTESGPAKVAVDSGFIVFNELNYPNFTRLLRQLDVPYQDTDMSFSVHCQRSGLEYNGTDLNRLFAQRRNLLRPSFYRMILDILRFGREAPRLLDLQNGYDPTLGEYIEDCRFSRQFKEHYILPMASALWSGPMRQIEAFPARYFVRFFRNHRMLEVNDRPQWKVIRGGSHQYVKALTRDFASDIHVDTPVHRVRRHNDRVELELANGERRPFDHVILATHSDQSLAMLADPTDNERSVLSALRYQRNETVLHTDTRVLPRRRRAWAAWNYHLPRDLQSQTDATVSYNMNMLQRLRTEETFCVTLNDSGIIDPESVRAKMIYHHPVYSHQSVAAQGRFQELDQPRTHYCGAYWGWGFHEDGVSSALRVSSRFGEELQ